MNTIGQECSHCNGIETFLERYWCPRYEAAVKRRKSPYLILCRDKDGNLKTLEFTEKQFFTMIIDGESSGIYIKRQLGQKRYQKLLRWYRTENNMEDRQLELIQGGKKGEHEPGKLEQDVNQVMKIEELYVKKA